MPHTIAAALGGEQASRREFEFTPHDFERIRKLIYDHAGIALSPVKSDMVYSRLARRMRQCGDASFAQYVQRLETGDLKEWKVFVNSLTTNLTSFFREAHHFEILAGHIAKIRDRGPLRIWCAAASTGEEPYSIAMTVADAYNSFSPPASILASDLDTSVLAHAERGVYGAERIERLPKEKVQRFFQKGTGAKEGHVRVRPELRNLITWKRINLLESNWPGQGALDAIFCRNVMIYFDKPTQYRIIKRMVPLLREDGLFFAGHSESFLHAADLLRPLGKTVYARSDTWR
jgi:chemotaxis protein methyltransferase CheR